MMLWGFLILGIVAALVARWRGGWTPAAFLDADKQVRRLSVAACIGVAAAAAGVGLWAVPITLAVWPGVVVGHGSYFPGGGPKVDNERFAPITRALFGSPLGEAGKAFGMLLTGLSVSVPAAAVLALAGVPGALWYALAGVAKPVAYLAPYPFRRALAGGDFFDGHTGVAELLWGFAAVALFAVPAMMAGLPPP